MGPPPMSCGSNLPTFRTGELQVHKPAYYCRQYEILFIAEESDPGQYKSLPEKPELSDDEISAIKTALHKITRRRIRDVQDAEDIVQDTLLTMITRYPENDLKKGMLVWCQGILRNKLGNYYRKTRRHSVFIGRNTDVEQGILASSVVASQETAVSNHELQSIIEEKLSEFPEPIRRAMELLVCGYEAGEIAKELSPEPYQNVINRLFRGRKRLARELMKCGFGPNTRDRRKEPGPGAGRTRSSRKVS